MADSNSLEPPPKTKIADPGAHQLAEASDSEDQFTDAQSDPESSNDKPSVPKTRVEKVDNEPSHGEVPGTAAYNMRQEDAEPDEIAVITDQSAETKPSPILGPIPTTVVEESPGGQVAQHSLEQDVNRKADAAPDVLLTSEGDVKEADSETPTDVPLSPASISTRPKRIPSSSSNPAIPLPQEDFGDGDVFEDEDDNFGDDFDDFEEGAHDDDFDDFEDDFQHAESSTNPTQTFPPSQLAALPFNVPDFDGLGPDEAISVLEPCLASLFPPEALDLPAFPPMSKDSSIFLTPRSASLWSQLVAPPPLAPPDWIRSRTRRLFLVSLGVPVDLDEILPASKQKKLVLPSLNIPSTSPRTSSDTRSVSRVRQGDGNTSTTSVDSQGKPSATSKRRKGPPSPPDMDLVAARRLCKTTDEALDGMTNEELKGHVTKLEAMQGTAKDVLDYWTKRTDEKIGDREAFEGVIENLVAHARKVRK